MLLFINPLTPSYMFIVASGGKILYESSHAIHGKEFESFPDIVHEIIELFPITKIAVVHGPGPFTALRIVTLTLNTIALVKGIPLVPLHFFELGMLQGKPLPYCLKANRSEYLVRMSSGDDQFVPLGEMHGKYWGYGDMEDFSQRDIKIDSSIDYSHIFPFLEAQEGRSRTAPLYIKDPKITPSPQK